MHRLALLALPLCLLLLPVTFGLPDEAVGRVVSVISGDSLGVEMLISDEGTNGVDSIKLADIAAPSTITAEGKAAQSYSLSLLKNKLVYLDINNNTQGKRSKWNQLICVIYLVDPEFRPVWPPVNRIIVDRGYAKLNDDPNNEFNSSSWWQKPPVFLPSMKRDMLRAILEKRLNPEEMFFVEPLSPPADVVPVKSASNTTNGTAIASASKVTPIAGAAKVTPIAGAAKVTPIAGAAKVTPVSDAAKDTPVAGAAKVTPVAGAAKVAPVAGAAKVTPVAGAAKVTPVAGATKVTPIAGATKVTPVASESEITPVSDAAKVTPAANASKVTLASDKVRETSVLGGKKLASALSVTKGAAVSLAVPANSSSGAANGTSVSLGVPVNSTSHIAMENTKSPEVQINSTSLVVPGVPKSEAIKKDPRAVCILEKDKKSGCISIGYRK